jgi:hypothetical protein
LLELLALDEGVQDLGDLASGLRIELLDALQAPLQLRVGLLALLEGLDAEEPTAARRQIRPSVRRFDFDEFVSVTELIAPF